MPSIQPTDGEVVSELILADDFLLHLHICLEASDANMTSANLHMKAARVPMTYCRLAAQKAFLPIAR